MSKTIRMLFSAPRLTAAVAILAGAVAVGIAAFPSSQKPGNAERSFERYADTIVRACAARAHRPSCYDQEIPKLMATLSLEDAFRVTRIVQERDQNYWYCHVLGHELATNETKKDPDRWKDVVARCPSGMCSNGCIHGAFQERFRAEALPDTSVAELTKELSGTCMARPGWDPTGLERATCYHALGHLAMYGTAANTAKSTQLCDAITTRDGANQFLQICYDGVFMQIFQPLEPEDEALVKDIRPSASMVQSFCGRFSGMAHGSCWSESWPLAYREVTTPDGLVRFCSAVDAGDQRNRCFSALFYVLMAQFNLDLERMKMFCGGLPADRQGRCVANAASRLIETDARLIDQSVGLCRWAAAIGVADTCYQELLTYSTYNFHKGSEPYHKLCNALPGSWRTQCLRD